MKGVSKETLMATLQFIQVNAVNIMLVEIDRDGHRQHWNPTCQETEFQDLFAVVAARRVPMVPGKSNDFGHEFISADHHLG